MLLYNAMSGCPILYHIILIIFIHCYIVFIITCGLIYHIWAKYLFCFGSTMSSSDDAAFRVIHDRLMARFFDARCAYLYSRVYAECQRVEGLAECERLESLQRGPAAAQATPGECTGTSTGTGS